MSDTSRVRGGSASTLPEGEVRRIEVPGRAPIALFRLADCFYATDDTCTHGAASLSDGFVENGEVECPYHSGRFDIRTGAATLYPCTVALRTYSAVVEDNEVVIDLTSLAAVKPRSDPT